MTLRCFIPGLRWLGWGLFLLMLVSLGWVLSTLPPPPRCRIAGDWTKLDLSRRALGGVPLPFSRAEDHRHRVMLSSTGRRLVSFQHRSDGALRVWDTMSGEIVKKLPIHVNPTQIYPGPWWLDFLPQISPNGRYFATLAADSKIHFIDLDSLQSYSPDWNRGKTEIKFAHFTGDSRYFALGEEEKKVVHFFRTDDGADFLFESEEEFGFDLTPQCLAPDGSRVGLWSGRTVIVRPGIRKADFSIENTVDPKVVFSPDSQRVMVWVNDGLGVWDVKTGKCLQKVEAEWKSWATSPDCKYVVSLGEVTRVWTVDDAVEITAIRNSSERGNYAVFAPHGPLLLLPWSQGWSTCWDLERQEMLWKDRVDGDDSIWFSENGRCLWVANQKAWRCLNGRSGETIRESAGVHSGENSHYFAGAVTDQETWIARWLKRITGRAASLEVCVCPTNNPEAAHVLYFDEPPTYLTVSEDGSTLLVATDSALELWDLPLRTPWLRVIGIPAAIGLFGILLYRFWVWCLALRRRRMLASLPPASASSLPSAGQ